MQLTAHFTLAELQHSTTAARAGVPNIIPTPLVSNAKRVAAALETIRARAGKPIIVHSCYRSRAVNTLVGGSKTSAHVYALAADITQPGTSVKELCKLAARLIPDYDQIIYEFGETGWCHIGFRSPGVTPRKQLLTATKEHGKTVYRAGIV